MKQCNHPCDIATVPAIASLRMPGNISNFLRANTRFAHHNLERNPSWPYALIPIDFPATACYQYSMIEGEFALLEVVAVERIGAFLDWGQEKDLFLPFAEQTGRVEVGEKLVVFIYKDKADRFCASMRLQRNKAHFPIEFKPGDKVDLIIAAKTDLGFKAVINQRHIGMLYKNEVFTELFYGQQIPGFIKAIREDGKIDLSLQSPTLVGHKAAADIGPQILELLKEKGGFLEINEKTPAEVIYDIFGVSKKKYKIALGGLYKQRLITIDEDGIRLVR